MTRIFRHRKVIVYTIIIALVTCTITTTSLYLLYINAQKSVYKRLTDIVLREKSFTQSLIKDNSYNETEILKHLTEGINIGEFGEIIYAKNTTDSIELLVCTNPEHKNIKYPKNIEHSVPLLKALNNETGNIKAKDHNGVEVFAAYTYITELNWAIVAKIPVEEINEPFIIAGFLVFVLAFILIFILVSVLIRFANPVIDKLLKNEKELIKAKEIAEDNEMHYRRIISTIPIMLYDYVLYPDGSNKFLYVGPNCFEILEYTQNELLDDINLFWNMVHKEDLERLRNEDVEANNRGDYFSSQVRIITPSGKLKWIEIKSRPNIVTTDKPAVWSGFVLDITDRKATEQKLKDSEDRFKKMFEKHNAIMLLIEPVSGIIEEVNYAATMYYGYNYAEMLTMKISDINTLSAEEIAKERLNALNQNRNYFIFPHKLASGEIRTVEVHSSPIEYHDKTMLFSIIHDITERLQAENQLHRFTNELSVLNKEKDRFISILAHDLRSPFSSLLGYTELLVSNLRKYSMDKIERQVKIIHSISNDTYNLLEDILLWSKNQSNKLNLEYKEINFNNLCNEIIFLYSNAAGNKNICLHYQPTSSPIIFYADENILKVVLRNLVSNAIKFTNSGGHIDIKAWILNENIQISVTDTGVGMSDEEIQNIWNQDLLFTKNGTSNEKGAGLGLTLCKELIEKHNGRIWVESEVGKGSNFKIVLPFLN